MADVLQRDRSPGAAGRTKPDATDDTSASARDQQNRPPRSDVGTIILHWTTAIAFVISLLTGIRMATFGWVLPSLSQCWIHSISAFVGFKKMPGICCSA